MGPLELTAGWPVPHVAAAVVDRDGAVRDVAGVVERPFRLASLTKMVSAWAVLVAVEEGSVALGDGVGQPGCTLRHLLAHAGGYPFEGRQPVSPPERRRIYSNTGIELAAAHVEAGCGFGFARYLREAVLEPLGMSATVLHGSPAHGLVAPVGDVARFLAEVQRPALLDASTAADALRPQFRDLAGIVPGIGRFDPCPWGLGFELRGEKSPHWTGRTNSAATAGHFGGAGTMAWVDPVAGCALVVLTDRGFDSWSVEAMRAWPELSDAVVGEFGRE